VLNDIISRLKRRIDRQAELTQVLGAERWCCPAGCMLGAPNCARASFRLKCIPARLQLASVHSNIELEEEREDFLTVTGKAEMRRAPSAPHSTAGR
jgi:hypothetical protein